MCLQNRNIVPDRADEARAQRDGSLVAPIALPVCLRSSLLLKGICHKGLVSTSGHADCLQEQALKKYIHCSITKGFISPWKAPWLFHLLLLVLQSLVKMTSVVLLNRPVTE